MTPSPEFLVIGLDGVPYTLLQDLCDQQVMPHIARLVDRGQSKPMTSSLPDVSSTAWTGFMTGTNPGKHGIFGFFEAAYQDYSLEFLSARDIQAPTLWEQLSNAGKKSLIVNVPQTYPASEINGVLLSGFVAPEIEKAVWPKSLIPELQELGYIIDVDAWIAREDLAQFLEELFRVLGARIRALHHLWDKEPWDFIMAVITGTDRLHHYLWDAVVDESHQLHHRVMEYYTAVDKAIGELLERISPETSVILLSDHGFTEIIREVNLNAWLRNQKYLQLTTPTPESLADMAPQSIAFALDPGRIYLNRADRFRQGWLQHNNECEQLRDELRGRIMTDLVIQDDAGNLVNPVESVFLPEEIYKGPHLKKAPDLILLNKPGYDFKGNVKIRDVARNDVLTGAHTYRNASLVISSPKSVAIKEIDSVEDIAPIILDAMLSAPNNKGNRAGI